MFKFTLENFATGQSVMTKDETTELMDCYNAKHDKMLQLKHTFTASGHCFY
jgi:hypothetical protein